MNSKTQPVVPRNLSSNLKLTHVRFKKNFPPLAKKKKLADGKNFVTGINLFMPETRKGFYSEQTHTSGHTQALNGQQTHIPKQTHT
mgnify:CR=1 FL=1